MSSCHTKMQVLLICEPTWYLEKGLRLQKIALMECERFLKEFVPLSLISYFSTKANEMDTVVLIAMCIWLSATSILQAIWKFFWKLQLVACGWTLDILPDAFVILWIPVPRHICATLNPCSPCLSYHMFILNHSAGVSSCNSAGQHSLETGRLSTTWNVWHRPW